LAAQVSIYQWVLFSLGQFVSEAVHERKEKMRLIEEFFRSEAAVMDQDRQPYIKRWDFQHDFKRMIVR